jgi:hypothetical protein
MVSWLQEGWRPAVFSNMPQFGGLVKPDTDLYVRPDTDYFWAA